MFKRLSSRIYVNAIRKSRFSTGNQDVSELLWAKTPMGFIKHVVKLVVSSQDRLFYRKLKGQMLETIPSPLKSVFAFYLYCGLKNPAVQRYKFNYDEFIVGARDSGAAVLNALIDPEFDEYLQRGDGKVPSSVEFVESVSSPVFFNICKDAFSLMRQHHVQPNLKSVKIGNSCVLNMVAECRDKEIDSDRSYVVQRNKGIVSATLANVLCHPNAVPVPPRNVAKEMFVVDDNFPSVPYHGIHSVEDSVLLTLDVYYEAKLTYGDAAPVAPTTAAEENEESSRPILKSVADKNSSNDGKTRDIIARLTFHGCISGQTDLDWKVVSVGFR